MQKPLASDIALITREELGLDKKEPVWDVCGLLESRGVKVLSLGIQSDYFLGLSVAENGGGPAIAINVFPRLPVERWIFSAIHELGHLVMHPSAFDASQCEEDNQEEREADEFASYFLMPRDSFDERWEKSRGLDLVDRILKIKRFFGVSYKTVIKRLIKDTRVDSRSIYRDFTAAYQRKHHKKLRFKDEPKPMSGDAFSGVQATGDRSREPQGLEPTDFMGERYQSLIRRGIEESLISLGWAAEALETDLPSIKEWTASWKYFEAA